MFIPGLELSRLFFEEVVQALLPEKLVYDAALIGSGSEVLGFDTERSTDHSWGPRLQIFLGEADYQVHSEKILQTFRQQFPARFRGFAVGFDPVPGEPNSVVPSPEGSGAINHLCKVTTVQRFIQDYLNYDWQPGEAIAAADWLSFTDQKLRTLVAGAVYHNALGDIDQMRRDFAYYPQAVWLYLLAASWQRVAEMEPFVGRCGDVGDDVGSRILAAQQVRDIMRLCFQMAKTYAPYPKWFGTGFARLAVAEHLTPIFHQIFDAQTWPDREKHLSQAYSFIAQQHNALGIMRPMHTEVSNFHDRPYMVIQGDEFADALIEQIEDAEVKRIAERTRMGSIDQFSDSTMLRSYQDLRPFVRNFYE